MSTHNPMMREELIRRDPAITEEQYLEFKKTRATQMAYDLVDMWRELGLQIDSESVKWRFGRRAIDPPDLEVLEVSWRPPRESLVELVGGPLDGRRVDAGRDKRNMPPASLHSTSETMPSMHREGECGGHGEPCVVGYRLSGISTVSGVWRYHYWQEGRGA